MNKKQLQKIGLNEKEASVYLALLEIGEGNIGQIAKKAAVKRTTVYDILASLKEMGLVSVATKGKKTFYFAEDPRKLEDNLEEKKAVLKRLMPELLAVANAFDSKPKVRFFEGSEGIKEVYKDTLRKGEGELLAWVTNEAISQFDLEFLDGYYLPKRVEKKIWVRAIAPEVSEMEKYRETDEKHLRKTRMAPADKFPFKVEINLYDKNKIAIMSFSEKFAMIVESAKIYETLFSIFELNWNALEGRNRHKQTDKQSEEKSAFV